jgi:structure-specific recognition protein 1
MVVVDYHINISCRETLKTKYEGKLEKHYESATYQVVSSVFRGLTGKKLTGAGGFQS